MSQNPSRRLASLAAIGLFAALAVNSAAVRAQTTPSAPGGNPPMPGQQNCAVSTARIGTVDVTEFFGIRGGSSGFAQNFGPLSSQGGAAQPEAALVQSCLRLEIDNPAPGDLMPVGGYVLAGFAFDPTTSAAQGAGISSVQVFLDDPNQGGAILGQTTSDAVGLGGKSLGLASPRGAAFGEQFASAGFRMTVQIPSSAAGSQHAVFVLAQSTNGRVGTVAVPVIVGNLTPAVPTRTP